MPQICWPTQNKVDGIFVEFLSHFALFGHCFFVLLVFSVYILISVFDMCFLFCFWFCLLGFSCLFF